jgi:hypothetical protein
MDTTRLANVIFDKGQKITQKRYASICESIDNDRFTLDEYVIEYKLKENFLNKIPFKLDDGTNILLSETFINKINSLDVNKTKLEEYTRSNYSNFKKVIEVVLNGSN